MIKIYGMESCPDCTYVWDQVQGDARYEVIDFGLDIRQLKPRGCLLTLEKAAPWCFCVVWRAKAWHAPRRRYGGSAGRIRPALRVS